MAMRGCMVMARASVHSQGARRLLSCVAAAARHRGAATTARPAWRRTTRRHTSNGPLPSQTASQTGNAAEVVDPVARTPQMGAPERRVVLTMDNAKELMTKAANTDDVYHIVRAVAHSKPTSGHVAFTEHTLALLDKLGAKLDVKCSDAMIAVFPEENTFKTASLFDAIWPKDSLQVDTAMKILDKMEDDFVIPESTTNALLLRRFGSASQPVQKCRRLAYWMRRFSFTNPFLPAEMPDDPLERAKILLARIGGKNAAIQVLQDEDDKKLMLAMTPGQKRIVEDMTADTAGTLQISGPHLTWFEQEQHEYHVLSYYDEDAQAVLGTCLSDTGSSECLHRVFDYLDHANTAIRQAGLSTVINTVSPAREDVEEGEVL